MQNPTQAQVETVREVLARWGSKADWNCITGWTLSGGIASSFDRKIYVRSRGHRFELGTVGTSGGTILADRLVKEAAEVAACLQALKEAGFEIAE